MFTCSICKKQTIEVVYSHDLVWCEQCYRKNQREIVMSNSYPPKPEDRSEAGLDDE